MQTIDPFPGHYLEDDPFGSMSGGRRYGHTGSDWGRGLGGEPIPAWAAGTVVANQWSDGNGNCLAIAIDGAPLYFSSIHMAEPSPLPIGAQVALGEHVGIVGNTGTNSQGAHYHSSLSDSPRVFLGLGNLQDPWSFIQAHLIDLTALTTEGEEMAKQTFVVRSLNGADPYYVTDGIYRRQLVAGESELLVQMGVAEKPDKPGGVHVVGSLVDRLVDAGRAISLIEYFNSKKG